MKRKLETRQLWKPKPFRIVACDPGGTTGWASATWNPQDLNTKFHLLNQIRFEFTEIGPEEHHIELYDFLQKQWDFSDDIDTDFVCESFEFRQHIDEDHTKTKVELISKEYIGVLRFFCAERGIVPYFQTASAAKTFVENWKIKSLGLWVPGQRHAMDAARHLLRHMVVTMKMRTPITDVWVESKPGN
jgi:hypothetical protein